jgi:hypothetical protein
LLFFSVSSRFTSSSFILFFPSMKVCHIPKLTIGAAIARAHTAKARPGGMIYTVAPLAADDPPCPRYKQGATFDVASFHGLPENNPRRTERGNAEDNTDDD